MSSAMRLTTTGYGLRATGYGQSQIGFATCRPTGQRANGSEKTRAARSDLQPTAHSLRPCGAERAA